jgi:hypothetical protein
VVRPLASARQPTPRTDSQENHLWTGCGEPRKRLKHLIYRRFSLCGSRVVVVRSAVRRYAKADGEEIDVTVTARE